MSKLAPAVSILVFMFVALAAANQENYGEKFSQAVQEIKHGRLEEGFKKLKELEAKAKNEELEIALGNVFLQKKQPEAAIPYYRNALRMNPFNERARWNWEVAIKMQSGSQSPPPPPPPSITPNQIPEESRALLDYFDQLEKEDRKQENKKNANESTFAW